MKQFLGIFTFSFLVLIFLSCTLFTNEMGDKATITFSIPSISQSGKLQSRSATSDASDNAPYYIRILLKEDSKRDLYQEAVVKIGNGATITFDSLAVGQTIHAEAYVFEENSTTSSDFVNYLYTGKTKSIKIHAGENFMDLKLRNPDSYELSFHANGGRFETEDNPYRTHTEGYHFSAPTPLREGYTFGGWALEANGDHPVSGERYILIEDTVLYAVWVPLVFNVDDESSFRDAIAQAFSGNTIRLNNNINLTSDLTVDKNITINGCDLYHLSASNVNLEFTNVTFTRGLNGEYIEGKLRNGFGGIITMDVCNASFTNCKFLDNKAYCGGAINFHSQDYEVSGERYELHITGCTFSGNISNTDDNPDKFNVNTSGYQTWVILGGGNSSDNTSWNNGIYLQPEVNGGTGNWDGDF